MSVLCTIFKPMNCLSRYIITSSVPYAFSTRILTARSKSRICSKMSDQVPLTPSTTRATPQFYRRTLPSTCISFGVSEGKTIFKEALQAGHMEGYFGLAAQFRTQDEPAFCGLSTLVMVLNTLEVDPQRVWKGPWRWYHENMLDCCVPLSIAAKNGVTLDELACLASCNTLSVKMVHMDNTFTEDSFREVVKDLTQREDEVLVLSYSRSVLGQTGDGHFSPVAGYHKERDLVLILDTARFKYPPHWVPLPILYEAMLTRDKDTGEARGFLRLRKSDKVPLVLFKIGDSLSVSSVGEQTQNSTDIGLESFIECWTSWLIGSTPGTPDFNILESATKAMIKCLQKLKKEDSILTTQVDLSCPQSVSATHGCVIQEILTSLESLPLYTFVKELVEESEPIDCLHLEVSQFEDRTKICKQKAKLDHYQLNNDEMDVSMRSMESCNFKLLPAHMVTILICAWPGFACNASNCTLLKKTIQTQLFRASSVLQDEVAQLSKQLNSILNFKECYNCECKS